MSMGEAMRVTCRKGTSSTGQVRGAQLFPDTVVWVSLGANVVTSDSLRWAWAAHHRAVGAGGRAGLGGVAQCWM